MYQYFVLLTVIISIFSNAGVQAETHACMHDLLVQETLASVVVSQDYSGETFPSGNNSRPIRIVFDTSLMDGDNLFTCYSSGQIVTVDGSSYTCKEEDVISSQKATLLKGRMLPDAALRLQEALGVLKMNGPLFLTSDYPCGFGPMVTVPHSFETQGVPNADLVVFVTARPINTAGVIALGSSCQQDQIGRPIAGQLNFNPAYLDTSSFAYDTQLGTAMHEVSHVLGFDFRKFAAFNTGNGTKVGYTSTTSNSYANNGARTVMKITTPAVQKWVREHFGCDTLDGAELEDGGTNSTRYSHWEKRVFMNDYMTGSSSVKPVLSGLTLALFEDSGWYVANYSAAEPLVWGKGQGCDFAQKSCGDWPANNGYFCSTQSENSCTFDHKAKGYCNVGQFTSAVPSQFQYFSNPLTGGSDSLADYCPFTSAYTNGWCSDPSNANSNNDAILAQTYGDDSMCFMSSVAKGKSANTKTQGVCMTSSCISTTQMKVRIGTLWHTCTKDGLQVNSGASGFAGTFKCPPISRVCQGAPSTENEWPVIDTVNPTKGAPGTKITITGSNLNQDTTVAIGSRKCDVTYVDTNGTLLECMIPTSGILSDATSVFEENLAVVISYPNGRNAFAPGFKYTGSVFFGSAVAWLKKFWFVPTISGVTLIVLITGCVVWIRKKKRNAKVAPMKTHQKDEETGEYYDEDDEYYDEEYDEEEYEPDGADYVAKKLDKK